MWYDLVVSGLVWSGLVWSGRVGSGRVGSGLVGSGEKCLFLPSVLSPIETVDRASRR